MSRPIGKVECPYCQHEQDAPEEETYYDEEEFMDIKCESCNRFFTAYSEVTISFRSEPLEPE